MPAPTHTYAIEIEHLLISPGHNYFGRPKDGPGEHPTFDVEVAEVVAGQGIVGDRFFGRAAHMDAAVTLIAAEALESVAAELGVEPFDPMLTRRNVVVRGADLNALLGEEFCLGSAQDPDARVVLAGRRPAAPCAWMDIMLAPGAHAALRGRGGLRCQVVTGGVLRRGPGMLVSSADLDPSAAGRPTLRRPTRLP